MQWYSETVYVTDAIIAYSFYILETRAETDLSIVRQCL